MTIDRHILVGRDVYARDDMKIGEVTGVTGDAEYVIVEPDALQGPADPDGRAPRGEGRLEVERTQSYLDDAPDVDPEHMTLEDRLRLERFYGARAA